MSEGLSQNEEFRRKLEAAEGVSAQVIVVFADIRDFSRFSHFNDPTDVAIYVSRIYLRLMEMFPSADFYKSTGDGLLITIPHDGENLRDRARDVVQACLNCVDTFAHLCDDDHMVNFEVPNRIGFGITRGSACRIVAGEEILDYSGHRLNLAARLLDLARPEGVVIDKSFRLELLDDATVKLFSAENVYVRSLAEETPIPVWIQTECVVIPDEVKRPLRLEEWETKEVTAQLKDWRHSLVTTYQLEGPLKRADGVVVKVDYPVRRAGKLTGNMRSFKPDAWEYVVSGSDHSLEVNIPEIFQYLRARRVQLSDK